MGMIPLYKHERHSSKPEYGNTGLWYDKFCDQWNQNFDTLKEPDGKKEWIETVTKAPLGNEVEIHDAVKRRKALTENRSGIDLLFRTDGRFVTGLGLNHPVENGFTWHHTLGTPYIPGTSVKGVVRAHTRLLSEEGKLTGEEIDRVFGPDEGNERSVGSIIFLDAIPFKPVKLDCDIMTPHYGPYYSSGKEIPGDWHSPTPIPFLVVDGNQEFLFGLIPRSAEALPDVQIVKGWLKDALDLSGAGAKTNVGYGRFVQSLIKSPAEQWLADVCSELNLEQSKLTSNPSKPFIAKWEEIEDEKLKQEVGVILKGKIQAENNWNEKRWGGLEKLKASLRIFLGE